MTQKKSVLLSEEQLFSASLAKGLKLLNEGTLFEGKIKQKRRKKKKKKSKIEK